MRKKTEKPEIRVQVTRKLLQDSLIRLMETKPILNITNREICESAGISRTTFYHYYKDQYDLLRQIEEQTFIEADKIIQRHTKEARETGSSQGVVVILRDILQFIADNGNSIQVLLSENGDSAFQKKFFRNGIEGIQQFTEAIGVKSQNKEMVKYSFFFVIGGMLTLVQEWLKNGMDTPVPEMAKMLVRLTREVLV
jgi:AcrR family transcriptional regulator